MATYTINITSQAELDEIWWEQAFPNWGFRCNEVYLSDCTKINDTTWQATYDSLEVTSTRTFAFRDVSTGSSSIFIVPTGEYGIKP